MSGPLRILILEDRAADAELATCELRRAKIDFESKCVKARKDFERELKHFAADVILADYNLPDMTALDALRMVARLKMDVPVILVTGTQSEETAAECIKAGAEDYILKSSLMRLPSALLKVLQKRRTEREKIMAEERLRAVVFAVESSMDGMAMLNAKGEYVYLNSAHAKVYGYDDPAELTGHTWRELYTAEELKRFDAQIIPQVISAGRWKGEAYGRRRDGSTFPQEISLTNVAGGGLICVVRDITERKQAEESRLALERKLLETQKLESLGVMAGGIAHDFNNLLAAILGNASLAALQAPADSPLRPYLSSIEATTQRAADLCKQMLAYAGKGRVSPQLVSLNAIIEEMTHLLKISIGRNILLKFNLARTIAPIKVDATQIRQVVMNLIINASEAIGDGEGAISLTTGTILAAQPDLARTYLAPDLPAGEYIFVEIADTGCGMDVETQSRIFDPFYTTKFTGRGLGLAAVLGIVRGHKGALTVESIPGQGTVFRVLLPVVNGLKDPAPSAESPADAWRGHGTILVVEDEPQLRSLHGHMLEIFGFKALLTADGIEGTQMFRSRAPDIVAVLLDLSMPRMSGEKTLEALREVQPDVRVILMTGHGTQSISRQFDRKNVVILQKPFTPRDLQNRLRQLLATSQ